MNFLGTFLILLNIGLLDSDIPYLGMNHQGTILMMIVFPFAVGLLLLGLWCTIESMRQPGGF